MGRRILAFFLGMIFGIVVLIGGVAGVIYYAATNVTPGDVYPDSNKFLGDLANMSLMDIYTEISKLYQEKIGKVGDNGLYYTLGEFLEAYNIDTVEAFGVELHQDILEIPLFEMIGGDTNAALGQIRVSAMFRIVNLFGAIGDEDGEATGAFFSEEAIEKVRDHSMADLLNEEKGMPYVFEDLLLCDVLAGMFPADPSDGNAVMWAFGQASIGRIMNGFGGNLLLQFKPNGVFEAMGSLPMTDLFGGSSTIMSAIFGNYKFNDLIDDEGNLNPDGLLGGVYIGSLLGLQRNEIADVDDYETLYPNGNVIYKEVDGEYVYAIVLNDVAYEAKLYCKKEHEHDASCYSLVWYKADATEFNEDNLATGIYNALADVTIADLMSGDSNALIDKFLDIQLKELLDGQEVSSMIASLGEMTLRELLNEGVDNVYLGTILSNERAEIGDEIADYTTVVIEQDGSAVVLMNAEGDLAVLENDVWYEGKIACGQEAHTHDEFCNPLNTNNPEDYVCGLDEHEHGVTCYKFVWYSPLGFARTGAQGYLCNFKLCEINSINELVQSMTLTDVFGEGVPPMLRGIKDTPIKHLETAINGVYLGEFLEYSRKSVDVEGVDVSDLKKIYAPNDGGEPNVTQFVYYLYEVGGIALSTNGRDFYQGKLLCKDETHNHTSKCYAFVWYEGNKAVDGIMGKLAGETVGNLRNIMDTIQTLTLKDVLGESVPDILKSIENTPIGELSTAIENMYLGDFLGYERKEINETGYVSVGSLTDVKRQGDKYIINDGDAWYEAKLICNDEDSEHTHTRSCYDYVWYDGDTPAEGITGKLASVKVSELNDINDKIMDFTLGDVMGNDLPTSLKALKDTKIRDLGNAIEEMYIGSFLGYERNQVNKDGYSEVDGLSDVMQNDGKYIIKDGKVWYEAKLNCNETSDEHSHGRTCFDFVWYSCGLEHEHNDECVADSLIGKMASMKIKDLSADSLKNVLYDTTLNEIIDMSSANNLLKEMGNTKIGELSSELNALYVGIAMGFHREEAEDFTPSTEAIQTDTVRNNGNKIFAEDGKYYFFDNTHNKYYMAKLNCVNSAHASNENLHGFDCYGFYWYSCPVDSNGDVTEHIHDDGHIVKGLNDKMSNLRIDELSGSNVANIAQSLTIGDLIDSGMMDLGDADNEYKFAIISCGNENHNFTASVGVGSFGSDKTFSCNLQDFFIYKNSVDSAITAKDYWLKAHEDMVGADGQLTDDGIAHMEGWKNQSLTDFINTLLSAL
ncbi:MAG: hypothetical protein J1F65_01470 [Clostridiales bacterium]|nr:hypothetical protein [Clostridiales bacterium]